MVMLVRLAGKEIAWDDYLTVKNEKSMGTQGSMREVEREREALARAL